MALIELLNSFDAGTSAMTAGELIAKSGIPRSSAFRELKLLVETGFLRQDAATKAYNLGPTILRLGMIARYELSHQDQISAPLMELWSRIGETVTFSILDLPWRTCTYVLEAPSDLRQVVQVGARYPLHQGAAGKVILAHLPDALAISILTGALSTGSDIDSIMKEAEHTRKAGFIRTTGERVQGASGVAAPVFMGSLIYGSIAVAGPSERALNALEGNEEQVVNAARDVSNRLSESCRQGRKPGQSRPVR